MPIVTSTYQANPPDAEGRMFIVERHTDHTGKEHMITYTCDPGLDPENIMQLRANRIGAEIDKAEAEALIASGGEMVKAWSQVTYWKLFTPDEYAACRDLALTNNTADYLLTVLKATPVIYANDPALLQGLDFFTAYGCLTVGRKEEILNG